MPLKGLVIPAVNQKSGQITQEYGPGTAMADDSNIARGSKLFDCFETAYDALLHINCPLPAANARLGC